MVLTKEQILDIYNSNETQRAIAEKYNIRQAHVSRIKNGQRWKEITKTQEKVIPKIQESSFVVMLS